MIDHALASADSLYLSADIEISSDVRFLALVRRLIEGLALELGWSATDSRQIKLAVDEEITNKIRHAYGSRPDARIRIEVATTARGLVLRLTDEGARPDDAKLCARAKDSNTPVGMGTHRTRV
jgi:anti-sigma regulatory factor (Ser/Thr protein kinase)